MYKKKSGNYEIQNANFNDIPVLKLRTLCLFPIVGGTTEKDGREGRQC